MIGLGEIAVVKRDGQTTEKFSRDKLRRVIQLAAKDVHVTLDQLTVDTVCTFVYNQCDKLAMETNVPKVGVEQIQDIVEKGLMEYGQYEVAKAYILFRSERAKLREAHPVQDVEAVKRTRQYFTNDLQVFQLLGKYARWNEEKGRRETWEEVIDRVIEFSRWQVEKVMQKELPEETWGELRTGMLQLEAFPSMRMMQMAGPAAKRCRMCIFNCSYLEIKDLQSFAEALYVLMQGTGLGFSVEFEFIDQLPRIKKQKNVAKHAYTVKDSTEGWCDALLFGLDRWFQGEDVEYDYTPIRPAGSRLRTKGGRASGPGPLKELLDFAKQIILSRQGRRLNDLDVHRIMCKIGKIVQVGGVRRAAMIGLSDLDSSSIRDAKKGSFWLTMPELTMANNSAVYEEKPDPYVFMTEWMSLATSGSGERGIFNRGGLKKQLPKRRKYQHMGTNPCGEVLLRSAETCNLSISVVRPDDTPDTLMRKVRLATIWGTIQSTMTQFRYLRDVWRENCEEERLLGVDLIGAGDNAFLRFNAHREPRRLLLKALRDETIRVNAEVAASLGINPSAAITCVKPSGNSGVFLNAGNTVTGRYAPYQIRNVRENSISPMCQFLISEGVPHEKDYADPGVYVFSFPVKAPEGVMMKDDLGGIDQLENWKDFKECWTEHNPSMTCFVKPDEWFDVGSWVYRNWDIVGGLSFLPASDHTYPQAPNIAITQEEYEKLVAAFPTIHWEKLSRFEAEDFTTSAGEFACVGGACDV